MYIEELIQFATGSGPWLFKHNNFVTGHDSTILSSLADQIAYNANQLTEKQGHLALRILNKHRTELRSAVPTIDAILDNPKWKSPFRVISQQKHISIIKGEFDSIAKSVIAVAFPYNEQLVESMRKRNADVHQLHKGTWDGNIKKWVYNITETNIEWIGTTFLPQEFSADTQFMELYQSVTEIFLDIETHLPMLVQNDASFSLKNCHKNIPQPTTTNLVEALFWAREYGITTWDDTIDNRLKNEINPVTRTILSVSNKKHPWVDNGVYDIEAFTDLLTYGGPAMVIIPGGSELEMVKNWSEFAYSLGVRSEDMSVMFRLPNEQSDFNQFVKDRDLNGPVTDTTKIVFVSTKITKPLIKSGVKFNTVINLGYYNYMHFTMSTVVDNARNLVYYSSKAPTIQKRWQQHEL
jgi:hypothetical protein